MRWLAKFIFKMGRKGQRFCDQDGEHEKINELQSAKASRVSSLSADEDFGNPLHVTVYPAQNGRIVRFSSYDNVKGQHKQSVYIIGKDEDYDECLRKYLAMESIRHA